MNIGDLTAVTVYVCLVTILVRSTVGVTEAVWIKYQERVLILAAVLEIIRVPTPRGIP